MLGACLVAGLLGFAAMAGLAVFGGRRGRRVVAAVMRDVGRP